MTFSSSQINRIASPRLTLAVIVIVTLTASVNRQVVGLIAQSVKTTFDLSDTQMGGMFSLAGVLVAIIAPLLGQLTDRFDRHRMLLASIAIWSIATAGYGVAGSLFVLALSFAFLAGAETILVPVCNSLISDRFRDEARINANLIYFAAGGLTTGVGTYVGGLLLHGSGVILPSLAQHWPAASEWRLAMIAAAIVGLPLMLVVMLMGRDQRQQSALPVTDLSDLQAYLQEHWRTLVFFNLSNAGYFIAATTIMGWMPIYLVRQFGLTPAELGMRLGTVIGIADVLGVLVGLVTIKRLYARMGPIAPRYIFQVSLGGIALLCIVQLMARDIWVILATLGLQNFLATFGTASFNNLVQDISAPGIRGKIFGLNALLVSIASIPGPLTVGMLSDQFAGDPQGLPKAMMLVALPALLFSIIAFGVTNRSYLRTVKAIAAIER